jgi:hypothetical protein
LDGTLVLKKQQLEEEWSKILRQAKSDMPRFQAVLRGVPEEPTAIWPASPQPQLLVTDASEWVPVKVADQRLKERHARLVKEEIPKAEEVSHTVLNQLREAVEAINVFGIRLGTATKDLMVERAHRDAVWKRLRALTEDYRKYQDAKKLRDRGGEVSLQSTTGICPTCHQEIKDTLLPQGPAASPMSLEDNMAFIHDQIGTFGKMLNDVDDVIEAKESDVEAILIRIKELNAQIRALKRTLHSDGRVPSIAAVQEQLHIEARLQVVRAVIDKFAEIMATLKTLSEQWANVQRRLKVLADVSLSADDKRKLEVFEASFVAQLRDYGFSSFPVEQISIGRESYRPSRDGYDIGLTSASDTIRMIWAYLLGMLEVGRMEKTNHLGFVVFDEPRQQGAEAPSFDALLQRAEEAGNVGQQVIVTTSEETSLLERILADLDFYYVQFDGKVLRPIQTAPTEDPPDENTRGEEPEEPLADQGF